LHDEASELGVPLVGAHLRWLRVLFAMILNRFIDASGWSSFLIVFLLAGILGVVGYGIGRDRQDEQDSI
jgi:hypothetical protein